MNRSTWQGQVRVCLNETLGTASRKTTGTVWQLCQDATGKGPWGSSPGSGVCAGGCCEPRGGQTAGVGPGPGELQLVSGDEQHAGVESAVMRMMVRTVTMTVTVGGGAY